MQLVLEIAAGLLGLAGVVLLILALRKRPAVRAEPTDLDRRRFMNRALLGSLGVFGVALGAGSISFLWPRLRTGYGSKIRAGSKDDVLFAIDRDGRYYDPVGKFYIVRYDTSDPNNVYVSSGVATDGLLTISQKCSHLGCRVPYCKTSGWFECPCHDAKFNGAGEVMSGPAPASMWHFPIEINETGHVIVDTRARMAQQPRGFETVGRSPKGAFCVTG